VSALTQHIYIESTDSVKQNMLSRVPTPHAVCYNAGFGIYVTPLSLP